MPECWRFASLGSACGVSGFSALVLAELGSVCLLNALLIRQACLRFRCGRVYTLRGRWLRILLHVLRGRSGFDP
jgi:hypothetical protein